MQEGMFRDLQIDLDREFNNNRSQNILHALTYTADDAAGFAAPGNIHINGDVRTGWFH